MIGFQLELQYLGGIMRYMDGRFCVFLFAALTAFSSVSFSQTLETSANKVCATAAEMTEFASNFSQFSNLAGKEYCLDGSQTSALIESLLFMKKTQFTASMAGAKDELFSGKFANDWYGYFVQRINEMDVQSSCEKGVAAYVYMWGNTMYVCPTLLSTSFTALDRASVFMHEARHIDGFPHYTCTRGPRMGMRGACDNQISAGGSYAVTVETYAQLAKYATGLHPALRSYAKASAVTYADEAFNTEVKVDRTPKFTLLTYNREFYNMDPTNLSALTSLGRAPELGRLVMRAQHMILFPENKTSPARFVYARGEGEIAQTAGDTAEEYNRGSANARDSFVDAHIGSQWGVQVEKSRVRMQCDPRSASSAELSFGSERAKALLYPQGYDRAAKSLQLQMESGKTYDLSCGMSGTVDMKLSGQQFDRVFKKMYRQGNQTMAINDSGELFKVQNGVSTLVSNDLDRSIYELVPAQTQSFFEEPVTTAEHQE